MFTLLGSQFGYGWLRLRNKALANSRYGGSGICLPFTPVRSRRIQPCGKPTTPNSHNPKTAQRKTSTYCTQLSSVQKRKAAPDIDDLEEEDFEEFANDSYQAQVAHIVSCQHQHAPVDHPTLAGHTRNVSTPSLVTVWKQAWFTRAGQQLARAKFVGACSRY